MQRVERVFLRRGLIVLLGRVYAALVQHHWVQLMDGGIVYM